MLQKENRLIRKDDFQRIHKMGRFFGDKFLAIRVIKNNLEVSRVGFLVGLKVSKKSTVRNKIRRRLREIFRLLIKEGKIKEGFDIIVLVRPEIVERDYNEIGEAIKTVLRKASLLR